MDRSKLGSWVAIAGGLAFVMVNAGGLPVEWSIIMRTAGVLAAAVAAVLVLRARPIPTPPPSRNALRVYGWSVTAMVLAIPAGASLLNGPLDAPDLTVVWVLAVVGAHFLPFASAFEAPVFRPLSRTLMTVAAVGAVATHVSGEKAVAAGTAVTAGFVLLGFAVRGVREPASGSGGAPPTAG